MIRLILYDSKEEGNSVMQIVICDDESYYREAITRAVQKWSALSDHRNVHCTTFASSEDLLERWEKGLHIDLLFLDIEIPGELNGQSLAKRIRSSDHIMSIVFVTNYENYVFDGYTVNAMRYLRKPIQESEIFSCLETAYHHILPLKQDQFIINERDQHFVLRYAEIIFIEARGHYLLFHLAGAEEIPTLRAKLSDVLSSLPPTLFVQCHRSYAVNLLHIRRFTKNMILVSNGPSLPVSQKYFPCLYNAFTQYYQEA